LSTLTATDGLTARVISSRSAEWFWVTATCVLYVMWSAQRSHASYVTVSGTSTPVYAVWILLFVLLALPAVIDYRKGLSRIGYVVCLGVLPRIPKLLFLQGMGELLLVCTLLGFILTVLLRNPRLFERLDATVAFTLLFVAQAALSLSISYFSQARGFVIVEDAVTRVVLLGTFAMLMFLLVQTTESMPEWYRVFDSLLKGVGIAILLGLFGTAVLLSEGYTWSRDTTSIQWSSDTALGFGDFDRLKGTFADPFRAALFFATSIPFLFYLGSGSTKRSRRILWFGAVVLAVLIVIAAGSRAGKLAAGCALIGCVCIPRYRRYAFPVLVFALPLLAFSLLYRSLGAAILAQRGVIGPDMAAAEFFTDTPRTRLIGYALESIEKYPLFGIGPGVEGRIGAAFDTSHNTYLNIAVEHGLLGLALFLILLASIYLRLLRVVVGTRDADQRCLGWTFLLVLVVFAVAGLFHTTVSHIWLWFVLAVAAAFCRTSEVQARQDSRRVIGGVYAR
jgi:hypothetical protein